MDGQYQNIQPQAGAPQPEAMAQPMPPQGQKQDWFDPHVQQVLFGRIQSLREDEVEILDSIVTPQTFPILAKVFPELISNGEIEDAGAQAGAIMPQQQAPEANPMTAEQPSGLMRR